MGCGLRDGASKLVRLIVAEDVIVFDLAGGAFGRGAHLHARPECLAKAPRGLARLLKSPPPEAAELGRRLVAACDRSMSGLLLTARRVGALAVGADASAQAVGRGAPLLVLAVDAGTVAERREVQAAVAEGRAIAWRTRSELGGLLGEAQVAICAVRHEGIAAKLKSLRAAADAGATMTREG